VKKQEACKDVEWAFGVLQSQLVFGTLLEHGATISCGKCACVIMHNMIIEEKCEDTLLDQGWQFQGELAKRHRGQHCVKTSSMCIMGFMIRTLTIGFKRID
jgi:hypothetical protein